MMGLFLMKIFKQRPFFSRFMDLFRKLSKEKNVVGFDFVELSSKGGEQDTRSEDTAATLISRLIGYKFLR